MKRNNKKQSLKFRVVTIPSYRRAYRIIHEWLRDSNGSAKRCESNLCENLSKNYHYALVHGKSHQKKRENYIQLCETCHRKYDMHSSIPDIEIDGVVIPGSTRKITGEKKPVGINITISREAYERILKNCQKARPRQNIRQYMNIINGLSVEE